MSAELTSLVPSMLAALPGMLDVSMLLAIAALGCFAGGLAAFVATRRTLHRIAWRLARFEQLANSTSMDLKTLLREGERFDEIARELHARRGARRALVIGDLPEPRTRSASEQDACCDRSAVVDETRHACLILARETGHRVCDELPDRG